MTIYIDDYDDAHRRGSAPSMTEAIGLLQSMIASSRKADDSSDKYWKDYIYIEKEAKYYSISLQDLFTIREVASNLQARTKKDVGEKEINKAVRDEVIRVYSDFCFGEDEEGKYNLFDKDKILQADMENPDVHHDIITLLEDLTSNNTEDMTYIFKWITWKYLHPLSPMQSALIMKGNQGIGKGQFCTLLETIFSPRYVRLNVSPELFSKGFSVTEERTLICELSEVGEDNHKIDAKNAIKLKALIMQNGVNLEKKHIDASSVKNHSSFVINSNRECPVLLESKEKGNRRYSVFEGSDISYDDTKGSRIYSTITDKQIVAQLLGFLLYEYSEELKDKAVFSAHKNEAKDILESNAGNEYTQFWNELRGHCKGEILLDTTIREMFLEFVKERGYSYRLMPKLIGRCPWQEIRPIGDNGKLLPRRRLVR